VREFETNKKPWPYESSPSLRCKCGISPTESVVPFELGYGFYRASNYGDYWVGIWLHRFTSKLLYRFMIY
jgi:hypothetical protein